jgi:glycosyltransferase involved in cell wall biosynthesis
LDDGSTDNTEELMEKYGDDRTIYVKREHVGLERLKEIYNHGLKLARGKHIAILEADDFYPKDKLEVQVDSLSEPHVVLSFGKVITVNEHYQFLGIAPSSSKFKKVSDWLLPLVIHDYICALTVMMQKQALESIGGFVQPEGARCVDYFTFLELALLGDFKFVNHVLGYWVRHGGNVSDMLRVDALKVNRQYVLQFCRKHNLPIPWRQLSEQDGRDLFHVGRHHLLSGCRSEAVKCFRKAFTLGSLPTKAKSIYGLANALVGFNLEYVAKMFGRPAERI